MPRAVRRGGPLPGRAHCALTLFPASTCSSCTSARRRAWTLHRPCPPHNHHVHLLPGGSCPPGSRPDSRHFISCHVIFMPFHVMSLQFSSVQIILFLPHGTGTALQPVQQGFRDSGAAQHACLPASLVLPSAARIPGMSSFSASDHPLSPTLLPRLLHCGLHPPPTHPHHHTLLHPNQMWPALPQPPPPGVLRGCAGEPGAGRSAGVLQADLRHAAKGVLGPLQATPSGQRGSAGGCWQRTWVPWGRAAGHEGSGEGCAYPGSPAVTPAQPAHAFGARQGRLQT